jgi:NAD(P)-dependent dehydrogenase (short-subunit alcohol dehydrogenase family)
MPKRIAASPSVVVITGATRGLGRALVARFSEQNWTVVGCGRSAAPIDELRRAHPAPHRFDVLDMTRADDVAAWARAVIETHGAPQLLLNNAAVINVLNPLWEVPVEEFSNVVDVNIKGVFHGIRGFLPAMVRRGSGVIVNFSSGWGRSTSAEVAPYCATKWAIEGLTHALAQELPRGLAAVALNPGIIDTDMLRVCFGGEAGHYPDAERWSHAAAPFLMGLTAADNGRSLTAPGA